MKSDNPKKEKVVLAGIGIVAPGAPHWKTFLQNMKSSLCHLEQSQELSPNFLVGNPVFQFSDYREWVSARSNIAKFNQLSDKGGENVQFLLGSTIQALESNPGLEELIRKKDERVLVLSGNAFGDLPSAFEGKESFDKAAREWNHFWADSSRNSALQDFLEGKNEEFLNVPPRPSHTMCVQSSDFFENYERLLAWDAYWARLNPLLAEFYSELSVIQSVGVGEKVASEKLTVMRNKNRSKKGLYEKYGCPEPPWENVNPRLLWNLPNAAAAQVTMLLGTHGPSYGMYGACATFGLLLSHALKEIQSGNADIAIVGTSDNKPPAPLVSAFYGAKVLAGGTGVSKPLTDLRGTHVSGGACTWILASESILKEAKLGHFGVTVAGVGLSSDAEHIITPSKSGPKLCMRQCFAEAKTNGFDSSQLAVWDMHATGTPGDVNELELLEEFIPESTLITARKGLLGHGMGSCGGWELTALAFSIEGTPGKYTIWPSGIPQADVHPAIRALGKNLVYDSIAELPHDVKDSVLSCGKLNMGIGGISSCVIIQVDVNQRTAFAKLEV